MLADDQTSLRMTNPIKIKDPNDHDGEYDGYDQEEWQEEAEEEAGDEAEVDISAAGEDFSKQPLQTRSKKQM